MNQGSPRSIDRAHMLAIASAPREGRVQRQVRRCFIAGDGKPRSMSELVAWAYPKLERHECWHRWSAGRPGIWALMVANPVAAKPARSAK